MKSDRHNKILEIISEKNIDTQEELVNALNDAVYSDLLITILSPDTRL